MGEEPKQPSEPPSAVLPLIESASFALLPLDVNITQAKYTSLSNTYLLEHMLRKKKRKWEGEDDNLAVLTNHSASNLFYKRVKYKVMSFLVKTLLSLWVSSQPSFPRNLLQPTVSLEKLHSDDSEDKQLGKHCMVKTIQ